MTLIGMKPGGAGVEVFEFCLGGIMYTDEKPRGRINWTCKSKAKERPGVQLKLHLRCPHCVGRIIENTETLFVVYGLCSSVTQSLWHMPVVKNECNPLW